MAVFDWSSLIPKGIDLGMKAVGDAAFPDPSLINARTNATNSQNDIAIARAKMANANQVRAAALPSMYTQLGYNPQQGRGMASSYSGQTPVSSGYSSGGGSGLGSTIGKTALGVGASLAPGMIAGALKSSAPALTRQAIDTGVGTAATAAAPHVAGGVSGALGLGGGSGLLGLGAATIPVLGGAALAAGLIWKHTQAHPIADQWVQSTQNPFDQHMRELQSAGLPPAQLQQAKTQSAQNYLRTLADFATKGGRNAEVARNAAATFRQYYGDPAQYGVPLQF